jgi:Cu-Zn family superoxide dismutase
MRPGSCVVLVAVAALATATPMMAAENTVEMHAVTAEGVGESIGTVAIRDSDQGGAVFIANLKNLSPGPHGFHIHENGSCEPAENDQGEMAAAQAAGSHWDPDDTGEHRGPGGRGHKGDLPVIQVLVDEDGAKPVKRIEYAPHVAPAEISGLALIIHQNGDNYRDEPKPLGGGGARVACGVIP